MTYEQRINVNINQINIGNVIEISLDQYEYKKLFEGF